MASYTFSRSISQGWIALPKLSRINLRIFWILSLTLITSLLFFYIFQINQMTTESFLISNYKEQTAGFSQQNKILETDFLKSNSLENVASLVKNSNFEKVEGIHYIRVLESTMVVK